MTREEALNELKNEWDHLLDCTGIKGREKEEAEKNAEFRKVYQANMMAIEALEQQSYEDCISRQAVLDDLEKSHMTSGVLNQGVWNECIDSMMRTVKTIPSVTPQPEPIRINLNEQIKVKLTDWGKEIYYHQYDKINQIAGREICKPMFPKEDENGYTKFQLWCFIELYGEHIGMAKPNVMEPLDIVYEAESEDKK